VKLDYVQDLSGRSQRVQQLMEQINRVAPTEAWVLITGDNGTGKEIVARSIHKKSRRRKKPMIAVNCAAIPEELLESVLFGHREGSFTGATADSEGKFAAADKGTLFLDEIAEMSPDLQSKLLRVLEEGEIDVVGETRPRPVDVRVLAATHRDIEQLVEAGDFREDLYYRLNVVPLEIPPLRERREDIPVLVRTFLRSQTDRDVAIDREVDDALMAYDWPGNVRELRNVVERMCLLCEGGRLTEDDIPAQVRSAQAAQSSHVEGGGLPFELPEDGLDLMDLERRVIEAVLEKTDGNQSAAARYLNLPRHKLIYRMEKFGLK
jgi:two-component system NtrC family response regulator